MPFWLSNVPFVKEKQFTKSATWFFFKIKVGETDLLNFQEVHISNTDLNKSS